jgi:hypothetical protein
MVVNCGMTVVFVIPKKLECLQLEAARIVTGLPIYSSAESLYFETGWSKLEGRKERLGTSLQTTPLNAIVIIITEIIC